MTATCPSRENFSPQANHQKTAVILPTPSKTGQNHPARVSEKLRLFPGIDLQINKNLVLAIERTNRLYLAFLAIMFRPDLIIRILR